MKCQGREQLYCNSPQGKTKLLFFFNSHFLFIVHFPFLHLCSLSAKFSFLLHLFPTLTHPPPVNVMIPPDPRPTTFSFLLPPFPILTLLPPQVPSTIYSLSTSCHRLGAQGLRRHLPQYDPGVPYEHHHQAISRITPNCQVVVTSCQSWLCPYETGFSGPATLSMTLPSGWNRF